MPVIRNCITIRDLPLMAGLLSVVLLNGCTTPSVASTSLEIEAKLTPPVPSDWIPVARYGRYTLVELTPQAAQHNLLLQTVDASIPAKVTNVGEALQHVLQSSGYTLCKDGADVAALYDLPLPAPHRQLGPILLHDALLTLAGPVLTLDIDNATRQVCFTRKGEPIT